MRFQYNDGGRLEAGFRGKTGDCAVRAIAIATKQPYSKVYGAINELASRERTGKRKRGVSNARTGVYGATMRRYMASIGWNWTPTMHIGSGCKVHLHDGELPMGRLIVSVSKHYTTIIDGVIHDTHDPQREIHEMMGGPDGRAIPLGIRRRCVYGYWSKS